MQVIEEAVELAVKEHNVEFRNGIYIFMSSTVLQLSLIGRLFKGSVYDLKNISQ